MQGEGDTTSLAASKISMIVCAQMHAHTHIHTHTHTQTQSHIYYLTTHQLQFPRIGFLDLVEGGHASIHQCGTESEPNFIQLLGNLFRVLPQPLHNQESGPKQLYTQ